MSDQPPRKKRHMNLSEKRALKSAEMQTFVQKYARKAQKSGEPNDRTYDRELERAITQMKPEELDKLLHDDED